MVVRQLLPSSFWVLALHASCGSLLPWIADAIFVTDADSDDAFQKPSSATFGSFEGPHPSAPTSRDGVLAGKPMKAANGTCRVGREEHKHTIGLPKSTWLPIAFELEFFYRESRFPKETADDSDDRSELFENEVLNAVNDEGNCSDRMFAVTYEVKRQKLAWLWQVEKQHKNWPIMWEVTTPITLLEDEAEVAIAQTRKMDRFFRKVAHRSWWKDGERPFKDDPPGLHIHVDSRCLMEDERRLAALLLIWEKFDTSIYAAAGVLLHNDTNRSKQKAEKIKHKSEELLSQLLLYVNSDKKTWRSPAPNETLTHLYNRLEDSLEGDKEQSDGFRRFEVNVCHLLNVKCAHGLPGKMHSKNKVPKFGSLEFRGFDPMIGEPLRLVVSLVERLVQWACIAPLHGALVALAAWDGVSDASDIKVLLKALDMDPAQFELDDVEARRFQDNFGGDYLNRTLDHLR